VENKDKKYTVIISERASEMLVSHARFLAQVSEQAAQNLIEKFKTSAKSQEDLPERNPILDVRYCQILWIGNHISSSTSLCSHLLN
jgi:hypothetical protein